MICPRCKGNMEPDEFGGVPIIACATCAGTWIDAGSVHRLFAGEKGAVDLANALEGMFHLEFVESRRQCPRCDGRSLKAVEVDNTELDYCLGCKGIFFDKGELKRVYPQTSFRHGHIESAAANAVAEKTLWRNLKRFFGGSQGNA